MDTFTHRSATACFALYQDKSNIAWTFYFTSRNCIFILHSYWLFSAFPISFNCFWKTLFLLLDNSWQQSVLPAMPWRRAVPIRKAAKTFGIANWSTLLQSSGLSTEFRIATKEQTEGLRTSAVPRCCCRTFVSQQSRSDLWNRGKNCEKSYGKTASPLSKLKAKWLCSVFLNAIWCLVTGHDRQSNDVAPLWVQTWYIFFSHTFSICHREIAANANKHATNALFESRAPDRPFAFSA